MVVHPPEVFDLDFLDRLLAFHRDVEANVPYVAEVTSLVNARNTRGEGDQLIVEDLLESWPQGEADLRVLRARVLGNPLYRNILISENGRYYEDTGDARWAVHETPATTGSALLFTSLILTFGFAMLMAAYLTNAQWFGPLTSFATAVAFVADVVVGPALMVLASQADAPDAPRSARTVANGESG